MIYTMQRHYYCLQLKGKLLADIIRKIMIISYVGMNKKSNCFYSDLPFQSGLFYTSKCLNAWWFYFSLVKLSVMGKARRNSLQPSSIMRTLCRHNSIFAPVSSLSPPHVSSLQLPIPQTDFLFFAASHNGFRFCIVFQCVECIHHITLFSPIYSAKTLFPVFDVADILHLTQLHSCSSYRQLWPSDEVNHRYALWKVVQLDDGSS